MPYKDLEQARFSARQRYWRTRARHKVLKEQRYAANRQKILAKAAIYRANHKEKILASLAIWRERNQVKYREGIKDWQQRNKGKCIGYINARRGAIAAQKLALTYIEQTNEIYAACPVGFHVDHIVPIKGKNVTGLHVPWNLQYLPARENIRKGNRFQA